MKRCPQCNTVFEDEMTYCKEDGTPLVNDSMSLPSDFVPEDHDDDEQETVLRHTPINFDISNPSVPPNQPQTSQSMPQQPQVNPYAPNHGNSIPPTPPKSNRGCLKYSLFLFIGLLLGGGAVLVIMGVGFVYMNVSSNNNRPPKIEKVEKRKSENNSNRNTRRRSSKKHSEPNTEVDDSKLNGRIIRNRASLKSTPRYRSRTIDRLPKNDRIEIIRRRTPTSSWYEVRCEHGSRGWISGYAIEFTD